MSSLAFSSRNKDRFDQKVTASSRVVFCVNKFSRLVSLALGITVAANSYASSAPSVPEFPTHKHAVPSLKNPSSGSISHSGTIKTALSPIAPVIGEPKLDRTESVSVQPKLRMAKAKKGDSVGSFMYDNFGTIHGWEGRLVNNRTGEMVVNPNTGLIAGQIYVLAGDLEQAITIASIFKTQFAKKTATSKAPEKETMVSLKSPEKPHNYFAAPKEEFLSIAQKVGLPDAHFSKIVTIAASVGIKESTASYAALGPVITREESVHYGKRAQGKYGVMPINIPVWSVRYFGTKLDFKNPVNQDKIVFARITEMYAQGLERGLSELDIVRKIGTKWYGTGPVMKGQPAPSKYQSDFVGIYKQISRNFDPVFGMAHAFKNGKLDHTVVAKAPSHEPVANYEASTLPQTESLRNIVKKVSFSTASANDAQFHEEKPKITKVLASVNDVRSSNEKKINAILQTNAPVVSSQSIAFTPVAGETTQVAQSLVETEYREEVMEKIQNDATIKPEVRKSILAKLHKTNLLALCKNNIEKYEADKMAGTAKEQKEAVTILPNLYKLLAKIEGEMENRMEDHRMIASNSNTYLRAA